MRPALSDYQHLASGKVRELYRIDDDHLLFVASDRISAFDYILDNEIPDKGRILTAMSVFFFDYVRGAQPPGRAARRSAHPRRGARPRAGGAQAGHDAGGVRGPRLPHRLRTAGLSEHRRGVRHRAAARARGGQQVRRAAVHAGHQGRTRRTRREHRFADVIDTGRRASAPTSCATAPCRPTSRPPTTRSNAESSSPTPSSSSASTQDGNMVLADEVFTPDSSRYWLADTYQPGVVQPSFDKQFVRNWLTGRRNRAGTATATSRRPRCRRRSSPPPATVTSKPTNGFRACASPTGSDSTA